MKKEVERNNNILAHFYKDKPPVLIESMQLKYTGNDWFVQISKSGSTDEDRFTYLADSCIALSVKNHSKHMELALFTRSGREIHKAFANKIKLNCYRNHQIRIDWITYSTEGTRVYGSHVIHKPILIDISC